MKKHGDAPNFSNFGPSKILSSNSPPPLYGRCLKDRRLARVHRHQHSLILAKLSTRQTLKGWSEMIPFPTSLPSRTTWQKSRRKEVPFLRFFGCQEIKSLWYREKRKHCEEPYVLQIGPLLMYHYLQNESNEYLGKIMQVDSSTHQDGLPCLLLIHLGMPASGGMSTLCKLSSQRQGQELPRFLFMCVCMCKYNIIQFVSWCHALAS